MNNMLPLQYASTANDTAQLDHRTTTLSMTILGPVHASKLMPYHETKDMSKIENHE
jgi:hypothetical protein